MQNAKEFTLELKKIDAGENPLRLEGENKGIVELAASIGRIGLINARETQSRVRRRPMLMMREISGRYHFHRAEGLLDLSEL